MSTRREDTPWLDVDLANLEGEEWRAVVGFEGTYEVSNYGRVKSLANSSSRKARLLRQAVGRIAVVVALARGGHKRSTAVRLLVAQSFGLQKPADHVWTYQGHVREDSRLSNIISMTRTALVRRSQQRGLWTQPAACVAASLKRQQAYTAQAGVFKDGVLVGQICRDCREPRELRFFRKARAGGAPVRVCQDCATRRSGSRQPGNARQGRELAQKGLRRCTLCKLAQPLDGQHFRRSVVPTMYGFTYTCLTCKPVHWTREGQRARKSEAAAASAEPSKKQSKKTS